MVTASVMKELNTSTAMLQDTFSRIFLFQLFHDGGRYKRINKYLTSLQV